MKRFRDLFWQRFGRLVAQEMVGRSSAGNAMWRCLCDCGRITVVNSGRLRGGNTQSCGCLKRDLSRARLTTHGHSRRSRTYESWNTMKQRCGNPRHPKWDSYGGRGIKACERWLQFENFLVDMGERPAGKSLDRFPNNDGNYEKGNCRWASAGEQARNRRRPRKLRPLLSQEILP